MIDTMLSELGDQLWGFPVDDVARMLSPKSLEPGLPRSECHHPISSFMCYIDDDAAQEALRSMPTPAVIQLVPDKESNYAPLADFFNPCVASCDAAYDQLRQLSSTSDSDVKLAKRTDRWWPTLKFSPFGRKTKDGFVDAAPLKPNLVAGVGVLDGIDET